MSGRRSPSRRGLLRRDRLLQLLARRFDHRLVVLRAGAGLGKSVLLAQAGDENLMEPRGIDVLIRAPARVNQAITLAGLIMGEVRPGVDPDEATIHDVTQAIWAQAPAEVALIIDDLHRFEQTPELLRDLEELLVQLPANGHLVLSTRTTPPVPHLDLVAAGEATVVSERDFLFTADELQQYAELAGTDIGILGHDGWPALTALRASVGHGADQDYVFEQVIDGLAPDSLAALQRLILIGRFDDGLVACATKYHGTARELAADLPLTTAAGDSYVLHDLWSGFTPALTPSEETATCAALGHELERRGEFSAAIEMFLRGGHGDDAYRILQALAADFAAVHPLSERRRVLAELTPELRSTPEARLIQADLVFLTSPSLSAEVIQAAVDTAVDSGNRTLEVGARFRLVERAFRSGQTSELEAQIDAMEACGGVRSDAAGLIRIARVWHRLLTDDFADAADELHPSSMDAPLDALEHCYRAVLDVHLGYATKALVDLDVVLPRLPGRMASRMHGLRSMAIFQSGGMNADDLRSVTELVDRIRKTGDQQLWVEGACSVAIIHYAIGEPATAARLLRSALEVHTGETAGDWNYQMVAIARAVDRLMAGDEPAATHILDTALPSGGPFDQLPPHVYQSAATLVYALVPRTRPHFDRHRFGPTLELAVQLGRALAALRDSDDVAPAAALDWSRPELLRPWLFEPHLIELAVAAITGGNAEARSVLGDLRHDPLESLQRIAANGSRAVRTTTQAIIKTTPRRPSEVTTVRLLGSLEISEGPGAETRSTTRGRVIELLGHLALRRRSNRERIAAAIWPDLTLDRGLANLRVTLTHLRQLLEPELPRTAPSWHITTNGDIVELNRTPFLVLDIDEFRTATDAARRNDRAGLPGAALEHHLAACAIYRGDLLPELLLSDVGSADRTELRFDFVHSAIRAAKLLTAVNDPDRAVELAERAVAAEPLMDEAHATLLRGLVASGRPTTSAIRHCHDVYREAGLVPGDDLRRALESPNVHRP